VSCIHYEFNIRARGAFFFFHILYFLRSFFRVTKNACSPLATQSFFGVCIDDAALLGWYQLLFLRGERVRRSSIAPSSSSSSSKRASSRHTLDHFSGMPSSQRTSAPSSRVSRTEREARARRHKESVFFFFVVVVVVHVVVAIAIENIDFR